MPPQADAISPPLLAWIKRDSAGAPYLAGSRCTACSQVFAGERLICANCCARGTMEPVRLAECGTLYTYTIVYRTFPGVKTPFVDVIADLEDGAHLKGTLLDVPADPAALAFDMKLRVVFHDAVPAGAGETAYLSYSFVPA